MQCTINCTFFQISSNNSARAISKPLAIFPTFTIEILHFPSSTLVKYTLSTNIFLENFSWFNHVFVISSRNVLTIFNSNYNRALISKPASVYNLIL